MRAGAVVTWSRKALPGSTSQRNAERRGLRVAYTRALFILEADYHTSARLKNPIASSTVLKMSQ